MNRILLFIGLACLVGCSSKEDVGKKPERYLYFTSNFPSSVSWEIYVEFTTTNESRFCKDFSMGEGGWVQKTRNEHYFLKKSGDTLKIPLYKTKTSFCDWEMGFVWTDVRGQRVSMDEVSLHYRKPSDASVSEDLLMPDSVAYNCKMDSARPILECEPTKGETNMRYLLDEKSDVEHLHIDLKGF